VFHTIEAFGWHRYLHTDGSPRLQSHCLASYTARIRANVRVEAADFAARMVDFHVDGPQCSSFPGALLERAAVVKLLVEAAPADLETRPSRATPDREVPPAVGARVQHPEYGSGAVELVLPDRIIVKFREGLRQLRRATEPANAAA
jgi:hypothetical protein